MYGVKTNEEVYYYNRHCNLCDKRQGSFKKKGYKVKIERITSGKGAKGCGYGIILDGDIGDAENILRTAGVKILEINEK